MSTLLETLRPMAMSKMLSERELTTWEAFERAAEAVLSRVERDVADAAGLSIAEFRILSRLVQLGNGRLRQRELALALGWDKSRISHQLTRMQSRRLLTRSKSVEHGSQVTISERGRDALKAGQPIHASSIRRHLLDRLTTTQAEAIMKLADASK